MVTCISQGSGVEFGQKKKGFPMCFLKFSTIATNQMQQPGATCQEDQSRRGHTIVFTQLYLVSRFWLLELLEKPWRWFNMLSSCSQLIYLFMKHFVTDFWRNNIKVNYLHQPAHNRENSWHWITKGLGWENHAHPLFKILLISWKRKGPQWMTGRKSVSMKKTVHVIG